MDWCSNSDVLRALYILKQVFQFIIISIPVILTIVIMVDLGKAILSSDDDISKIISSCLKKLIIAVLVYFLPSIIISFLNLTIGDLFDSSLLCLDEATITNIEYYKAKEQAEEKAEIDKLRKETEKQTLIQKLTEKAKLLTEYEKGNPSDVLNNVSKTFVPYINGVQRTVGEGECMSWEDNCFCPTKSNAKGFQFIMQDEKSRYFAATTLDAELVNVKVNCSDGTVLRAKVLKTVEDNFRQAFENVCKLRTTGINGFKINATTSNGSHVARTKSDRTVCSPHAYAIAIDFNNGLPVTVDGVEYQPFTNQGAATKQEYMRFVKALGKEEDSRNVNYIMWKYAFEPAGFEWGGEWHDASFDPMHFEVK